MCEGPSDIQEHSEPGEVLKVIMHEGQCLRAAGVQRPESSLLAGRS